MQIWGLTEEQVYQALADANKIYEDNLLLKSGRWNGSRQEGLVRRGRSFTAKLYCRSSRAKGAKRVGVQQRRSRHANYHAHYAFMFACFAINPEARIKSMMEDYKGVAEFLDRAEDVGKRGVASFPVLVTRPDGTRYVGTRHIEHREASIL